MQSELRRAEKENNSGKIGPAGKICMTNEENGRIMVPFYAAAN